MICHRREKRDAYATPESRFRVCSMNDFRFFFFSALQALWELRLRTCICLHPAICISFQITVSVSMSMSMSMSMFVPGHGHEVSKGNASIRSTSQHGNGP